MDRTVVLTQGSIPRQLIWLALPLICGNILQQLYNTVDAFIIGRFLGGAAFGAVGVAGTVMNLFIFILSGCCTGIAVLFAQFYGSRDLASFRREGFLSLVFGLLLTAVLGLGGLVLLGPLLGLIQTPGELRPLVTEYLNVIFLGLPVTFLYNLGSAALRAAGNTLAALLPLAAATMLNVGLDLLFVGACSMGIAGAAIATVLAQGAAALMALAYLKWRLPQLLFGRADMKMDWGTACSRSSTISPRPCGRCSGAPARRYINITYAITISHKERFITYILLYSLNSSTCHSIKSCINYSYLPRLTMLFVDYHIIRTFSKVKCNITIMKEIISEPFLYYILLITSTYNKFIKSIIFIFFHNMPKNWLTANLNHWLWLKLAFFTYSCSETTS